MTWDRRQVLAAIAATAIAGPQARAETDDLNVECVTRDENPPSQEEIWESNRYEPISLI